MRAVARLGSVRQQRRAGAARRGAAGDAEQVGLASGLRGPIANPRSAGRVEPVQIVEQALAPDGVGALAQQLVQLVGQPFEPAARQGAPALESGCREPVGGCDARHPFRTGVGKPGAGGDVEQQFDLVALDAGGGGQAAGVGKRDPSA